MALAAHDALMINYSALSSIAFLVWDLLLTFDDEVTYIWPQPKRSPSKWLFLFTRYYSLVCQMSGIISQISRTIWNILFLPCMSLMGGIPIDITRSIDGIRRAYTNDKRYYPPTTSAVPPNQRLTALHTRPSLRPICW
ncbi:hypothetical protein JAAARDRAFT_198061 [Jaapia argillacea MUCL 33604]|uniref:DUF6533 domain-containing protein n=1 Tax=Jaapia argillacea MUCL 33604 TaxID=933084 RepID=A0A067PD53_9AGAM|nr:hypothetical protein JAAARDRAFT_198061 [Jaapia argillacea MUCL 33604]